jgi:hypothetical protein
MPFATGGGGGARRAVAEDMARHIEELSERIEPALRHNSSALEAFHELLGLLRDANE